jgi:8-amino-7-oxononanoate synthase
MELSMSFSGDIQHPETWTLPFRQHLEEREQLGLYRQLPDCSGRIDFCSNDYLGFARNPELLAEVLDHYRDADGSISCLGATGSRLVSGTQQVHREFEEVFAKYHDGESSLLCTSGYVANLALFSTLPRQGDTVLYDSAVHASIRDGLRLTRARSFSFSHNDCNDLETKLRLAKGQKYIAIEGLYSMDGDFAPLKDIVALAERYGAIIIIDEAHSGGIVGPGGRGQSWCFARHPAIGIRIFAFGKAYGIQGAAIVVPAVVREYLINFARSFIYTTGMSPFVVRALQVALNKIRDGDAERAKLRENIQIVRNLINLPPLPDQLLSPIVPLFFPGGEHVRTIAARCQAGGYAVVPIVSPTVPTGTERIRLTIHSVHTKGTLCSLAQILQQEIYEEY